MSEINLAEGVIRKGKQLVANPANVPAARAFVAELRRQADEAEQKAAAATPYKARLLLQNARAARRDADRIESTIPSSPRNIGGAQMPNITFGTGTEVRMKSGTEGWIRATIVEYYDVLPTPGGYMYGGGMTPGYKVHILEGKHKGETINVPLNYVEAVGAVSQGKPKKPYTPSPWR